MVLAVYQAHFELFSPFGFDICCVCFDLVGERTECLGLFFAARSRRMVFRARLLCRNHRNHRFFERNFVARANGRYTRPQPLGTSAESVC
jgi:hypothetical protein